MPCMILFLISNLLLLEKNTELDVDTQEVNNVDGSAPKHAKVKF